MSPVDQTPRSTTRKARTMGVSRDFSTAHPTGATTVMDRENATTPTRTRERTTTPPLPRWTTLSPAQSPAQEGTDSRKRASRQRLGSRQVVSVRGRRVAPIKQVSLLPRLSAVAITLMIVGAALAMWLSGVATQQTFRVQQLNAQDQQLSNQIETLNRDLANVSSNAEITRRASDLGMVVPNQPGILTVENSGDTVHQRPADPATSPIIDVNGAPVRSGQASSDPNKTDELTDTLESMPEGERLPPPPEAAPASAPAPSADIPAVAPYVNGGAPAPAPAPEAEQAEQDVPTQVAEME